MKNFDNISYLNENYRIDPNCRGYTEHDLGDGLVLQRSDNHNYLLKDGQEIRKYYIADDGITSCIKNNKKQEIWYKDGKYRTHM